LEETGGNQQACRLEKAVGADPSSHEDLLERKYKEECTTKWRSVLAFSRCNSDPSHKLLERWFTEYSSAEDKRLLRLIWKDFCYVKRENAFNNGGLVIVPECNPWEDYLGEQKWINNLWMLCWVSRSLKYNFTQWKESKVTDAQVLTTRTVGFIQGGQGADEFLQGMQLTPTR
jgi:hypothetical protein